MYYSFEGNQFFFYISLSCNHIHFVLFQKFKGSKSYDSLIFFGLSKVLTSKFVLVFAIFEHVFSRFQ